MKLFRITALHDNAALMWIKGADRWDAFRRFTHAIDGEYWRLTSRDNVYWLDSVEYEIEETTIQSLADSIPEVP